MNKTEIQEKIKSKTKELNQYILANKLDTAEQVFNEVEYLKILLSKRGAR